MGNLGLLLICSTSTNLFVHARTVYVTDVPQLSLILCALLNLLPLTLTLYFLSFFQHSYSYHTCLSLQPITSFFIFTTNYIITIFSASTLGNSKNPPVVVGTGRQMPYSTIRPLILKLPQNFFYICFDLPGNGTSDHLPKGVRFTIFDLIPSLLIVSNHFKCEKFIYIGHSLGTLIGEPSYFFVFCKIYVRNLVNVHFVLHFSLL